MTPVEPLLLDAVSRLVALLDSPQDLGPLAPLVLREITYRLLTGPQGVRLRQTAAALTLAACSENTTAPSKAIAPESPSFSQSPELNDRLARIERR